MISMISFYEFFFIYYFILFNNMNHSSLFTKQNLMISSMLIILLLYYFYKNKNINMIDVIENKHEIQIKNEKPRITSKDIDKYIQREFSKVLKIFAKEVQNSAKSMSEFNHDFLLKSDYLNFRNNLFTKDIEKFHILVDSKSLEHTCLEEECNCSSNYTFSLESSGFGRFKNVIGFRCIRAYLPTLPWNINQNNNQINISWSKDGDNGEKSIALDKGLYDNFEDVVDSLEIKLNKEFNIAQSPDYPGFICIYKSDRNTYQFSKKVEGFGGLEKITGLEKFPGKRFIIILYKENDVHTFTLHWDNLKKSANRFLGFKGIDEESKSNPNSEDDIKWDSNSIDYYCISNIMPDLTNHFVDLVIDEIPYIACKKNPLSKSILERIPTDTQTGGDYVEHHVSESEYFSQNYFYPLSLDKLTIQLFDDSLTNYYFTNNLDNSFVFEITMLKNTKSLNHITHK